MIFVNKGDKPLSATQLEKRAQKYITRAFPPQAREESIRKGDDLFSNFMVEFSQDHAVNVENNTFNCQLVAYKNAVARLEKPILLDSQEEFVEVTVYSEDPDAEPTVEQVRNPLVVQDEEERAMAQSVIEGTPQAVKDFRK
jgi:hypothetical protein